MILTSWYYSIDDSPASLSPGLVYPDNFVCSKPGTAVRSSDYPSDETAVAPEGDYADVKEKLADDSPDEIASSTTEETFAEGELPVEDEVQVLRVQSRAK